MLSMTPLGSRIGLLGGSFHALGCKYLVGFVLLVIALFRPSIGKGRSEYGLLKPATRRIGLSGFVKQGLPLEKYLNVLCECDCHNWLKSGVSRSPPRVYQSVGAVSGKPKKPATATFAFEKIALAFCLYTSGNR